MRKSIMIGTIALISAMAVVGCGGDDDPTPAPAATPTVESVLPNAPASGGPAQQETTDSSSESTATVATTGDVAPTGNAAVDAVAAALRKQIASLPMRMTVGGAGEETMVAEMASPTRFRVNAGGMEFMLVDGTVYMNQGGTWIANDAMGGMVNAMVEAFTPESIEGQIATIVDAEQLPDEQVDGEAANVYLMTVTSPADGEELVVSKVYVRRSDGLPIRVASADGAETAYQVTYEYDSAIVIEAPQ